MIPDPIEIMNANIERMIDSYRPGFCMGCGKDAGEDGLIQATPSPDAPAVCYECAGLTE